MTASIDWSRIKPGEFKDSPSSGRKRWLKPLLLIVLALVLVGLCLGIWWSREPDIKQAQIEVIELAGGQQAKPGGMLTAAIIIVVETLLDKSGGLLSNDLSPPGILLDNMPSWEQGVMVQVRDLSKAMRDGFSRSQSQSQEDTALAKAEPNLNFGLDSWILPSSEGEYRSGVRHLRDYLFRLQDEEQFNAQFFARADNLERWLQTVENRLGSLSQKLSASVGQRRLNTDLAGDASARQSTESPTEIEVNTHWQQVDNVFYEARGSTWELIQF